MQNQLIMRIEVLKFISTEFEGKKTFKVQAIFEDEKKGFEIVSVKLIDNKEDIKDGDLIEVPVKVTAIESKKFFTQIAPLKKLSKGS